MIKMTGTNAQGDEFLCIGLSAANWRKLMANQPILIELKDLKLKWKGEILLIAGETEQSMVHMLSSMGILRDVPVHRSAPTEHINPCKHEHLTMEGICHACGADCRGIH